MFEKSQVKKRVPTGIHGFDELCGGGLLRNRTYLVSGTAGAGKNIFGLQYLYNGITKYNENGIYIATEETPEQVRENVKQFGWDFKALENEGRLAIVDACSTKIGLPTQEKYVYFRPFYLQEPLKIRIELLRLSTTLEMLNLTSLMTCEIINENMITRFGVEDFVTEGTILMSYKRKESIRVGGIKIIKRRGTSHSQNIHPYEITSSGIVVHQHEEVYSTWK